MEQSWKVEEGFPSVPGADPGRGAAEGWLLIVSGPPRVGRKRVRPAVSRAHERLDANADTIELHHPFPEELLPSRASLNPSQNPLIVLANSILVSVEEGLTTNAFAPER